MDKSERKAEVASPFNPNNLPQPASRPMTAAMCAAGQRGRPPSVETLRLKEKKEEKNPQEEKR